MPTTTSNQQIPLPVQGDDPNIVDDLTTLVTFMEKQLVGIYASVTDRNARATSPKEGQIAFTKDANLFWLYDGTTWQQMYISIGTYVPQITSGTAAPSGGNNGDVYFKV